MKKILAIAAVAALTAGVSAYAANPFSDVTPSDWAYQAVVDLSEQGVVEGYPDGTFKGERNITRYEMAQIIARMLAKEDQLNAEQRATLDKLAGEYADELANLGVRVSNLEKKVGNLSFSGNARMRMNQNYAANDDGVLTGKAKDSWNGRMQLNIKGQVNDSTYVLGRLRYDMNFKNTNEDPAYLDQLIVHHDFGDKASVNIGKIDLTLGQTGLEYDDEFKGAIATIGSEKLALDVGYGRFTGGVLGTATETDGTNNREAGIARLYGASGIASYDVEYIDGHDDADARIWGAGLTLNVVDQFRVFGDFYKNTEYAGNPQTWTAGLGYGSVDLKKPGTFQIAGQYVRAERGSFMDDVTYDVSPASVVADDSDVNTAKYWLATGDVVLAKNIRLHGEYAFDVKTDKGGDYDDLASVSLNYSF